MPDPTSTSKTPESREALTARWFHVGRPWSDQPGLIYAGSEDPHAGTFVVDCRDWADELHFGEAQTVDVAALADGIVRDHNAALIATPPPTPAPLDGREALDLDELERLAAGATPGPWRACPHVAGTDPQCPCRYRGDVVSEATEETLFQMGVGPDKVPDSWDEAKDAWKGIKTTDPEQGYANGRFLAALSPEVVSELIRRARLAALPDSGERQRLFEAGRATGTVEGWADYTAHEDDPPRHDDEYDALARQLHESIAEGQSIALTAKALRILALPDSGERPGLDVERLLSAVMRSAHGPRLVGGVKCPCPIHEDAWRRVEGSKP